MHNVVIQDGKRTVTFLQSAIRFYIESSNTYSTMLGERHYYIIQEIARLGLTDDYKKNHTDGFLCRVEGKNEIITFISRENATAIAKRANYPMISSVLTSEDLW